MLNLLHRKTLTTGQTVLQPLSEFKSVGELVIGFGKVRRTGVDAAQSIELRSGDRLLVPQRSQVVTVIGEPQQNSSRLDQPGLSREDYMDLSGGLTKRADKKLIFVVRTSAAVVTEPRTRWLGSRKRLAINSADRRVVPPAMGRIRPVTFWTKVTQVLFQGAISAAAIRSFERPGELD
jgi:hypothetical protein